MSEPHVSDVAPKPTKAPAKHDVHVPASGEKYEEKEAKEAKKEVKDKAKTAEKDVKKAAASAEESVKKGMEKAEKKGKELKKKAGVSLTHTVLARRLIRILGTTGGSRVEDGAVLGADEGCRAAAWYPRRSHGRRCVTQDATSPSRQLTFGLPSSVNVGLLGTMGYFAYTRKDQPWDRRIVGSAVAGTLALFGAEG